MIRAIWNKFTQKIVFTYLVSVLTLATNFASAAEWYVAPTGTNSGDGSKLNPWTLQLAFAGASGRVKQGDTVWIRGGTYSISGFWNLSVSGTSASKVTFRNFNNERAILDGPIRLGSSSNYLRFWGLELVDSLKATRTAPFVHVDGNGSVGNEWINNIVHDVNIAWAGDATNGLNYGNIVWYAGQAVLEHGIYGGILGGADCNIYSWTSGYALNVSGPNARVENNVLIGSGITIKSGTSEIIISPEGANNIIRNNYLYSNDAEQGGNMKLGYEGVGSQNLLVDGNLTAGGGDLIIYGTYSLFNILNNTFHSIRANGVTLDIKESSQGWIIDNNKYSAAGVAVRFDDVGIGRGFADWKSAHSGYDIHSTSANSQSPADSVVLIPNQYESKRAHIVVQNWSKKATVPVSLASVLSVGDSYSIKSAGNFFGPDIISGVYSGGAVQIPMQASQVTPILFGTGMSLPTATLPEFGAFVLIGKASTNGPAAPTNLRFIPAGG